MFQTTSCCPTRAFSNVDTSDPPDTATMNSPWSWIASFWIAITCAASASASAADFSGKGLTTGNGIFFKKSLDWVVVMGTNQWKWRQKKEATEGKRKTKCDLGFLFLFFSNQFFHIGITYYKFSIDNHLMKCPNHPVTNILLFIKI